MGRPALVLCAVAPVLLLPSCFRLLSERHRHDDDDAVDSAPPDGDGADADGADAGGTDADGADADEAGLDGGECTPQRARLVVEADEDDGELATALRLQGRTEADGVMMGYWENHPARTWGFFRFRLPEALPSGAEVVEARLRLWGRSITDDWSPSRDALRIWAEDSADSRAVEGGPWDPLSPADRPLTDASVRWPSSSGGLDWRIGAINVSDDLSPLVQELVNDHGGLAAGSHVQLWIAGDFLVGNREVGADDWNNAGSNQAVLQLSFCPEGSPCTPTSLSVVVEANEDDGEIDDGALLPWGEVGGLMVGSCDYGLGPPEDLSPQVWGFFRFRLEEALPPDARVVGATIGLWGHSVASEWDSSRHALRIWAEDSADAAAVSEGVTDATSPAGRTLTTTSVRWPATEEGLDWRIGEANLSPSLAPIIEELLLRHGGLGAGSHVQLWVSAEAVPGCPLVGVEDWSFFDVHPATLDLSLCP